jgi:hypothetical protein
MQLHVFEIYLLLLAFITSLSPTGGCIGINGGGSAPAWPWGPVSWLAFSLASGRVGIHWWMWTSANGFLYSCENGFDIRRGCVQRKAGGFHCIKKQCPIGINLRGRWPCQQLSDTSLLSAIQCIISLRCMFERGVICIAVCRTERALRVKVNVLRSSKCVDWLFLSCPLRGVFHPAELLKAYNVVDKHATQISMRRR